MNFKLEKRDLLFLILLTTALGIMQVTTPLLLRTLIDGIIPSRDGGTIAFILFIIGTNELLLIISNATLSRQLDNIEKTSLENNRNWMLNEITKNNQTAKDSEKFYLAWSNHLKQLIYKKIKNPWFRIKDFVVLILLTFICLNISYFAGFLVVLIAIISLVTVKYFQENQGVSAKLLYMKSQEEKNLFNDFLASSSTQRVEKLNLLKAVAIETNDLQFQFAKEKSSYQNINNLIRFTIMFSILGVGSYLFATSKLSMGSLWALIITMYRITPSLQSIVRWFLQTRSDDNLEDRVWEGMRTVPAFKKPEFYNRLVKIIELYLQNPGPKWVKIKKSMSVSDLISSLELWKGFYSRRDGLEILTVLPETWDATKTYFYVGPYSGEIRSNLVIFCHEDNNDHEGYQVLSFA